MSAAQLSLRRRPRRLRRTPAIRRAVAETRVEPEDLIAPLFVLDGEETPAEAVESMPGVMRRNVKETIAECQSLFDLGVPGVALFPCLDGSVKDDEASAACDPEGLIPRCVAAIKAEVPGLIVITDIALDPFTSHGHDGLLGDDGDLENDTTVAVLRRMAVVHGRAGADFVAPSDMMDGRIGALRESLDEAGLTGTGVLAYSAKYASAFYGPFRDAVGSSAAAGTKSLDKGTYQLDPANRREAHVETQADEEEAADILMVKPAGAYLDVIRELRQRSALPVAAYQVSGEYAMISAAAERGWLDRVKCIEESLLSIKRAGADMIFTYFAKEVALRRAEHARARVAAADRAATAAGQA